MKNRNAPENQIMRRILVIACGAALAAAALAVAFMVSLPQPALADITLPPMPPDIQVPAGNKAFLVGHAVGTQNYVCLPSGSGFAWTLFTPQATLFGDDGDQVITHLFSPNPDEDNTNPRTIANGRIRAAWQHSRDSSTVWAGVDPEHPEHSSIDPNFVAKGAVPWLLLTRVGSEDGPTGGDSLTKTTFIQRLTTAGGVAPSMGCASASDIGKQAFVPYTADYFFYKGTGGNDANDGN